MTNFENSDNEPTLGTDGRVGSIMLTLLVLGVSSPTATAAPIGPQSQPFKASSETSGPTTKSTSVQGGTDDASDPTESAEDAEDAEDPTPADSVTIIGSSKKVARIAGSAHQVGQETLERQEYDDIHRVLKQIPGVYVREEDGFGLRPNIGLRGANSDRSAKVTLMEDGILMAPAPYSAPAAYYFPLSTRLVDVEVFKGPASIKHGPNTIGGAVNTVTRSVPTLNHIGGIDLSAGMRRTQKVHTYYGYGERYYGVLVEGASLKSDGFKELDGGGGTGFDKFEVMLKLRVNNDPGANVHHRVDLKLGYSDERSHETYLG
ncbi:MAG: TonB-dependent receptor plug domain-containing protein, partial [Myxococcota bacterium]|nr:TonB-dependent receptor plug domain-containing protein [Myxococcota bacterium]